MNVPVPKSAASFLGTDRFIVEQLIGEGGMGTVYQAYDRETEQRIALKVLHRVDANNVYRMKQEFRRLADIVHPNLIQLYELFFQDGLWFFTMERLVGRSFVDHVRSWRQLSRVPAATTDTWDASDDVVVRNLPTERPREHVIHTERLRDALAQLMGAVAAIHGAGLLHRDLKPSNVMVEPHGRTVVLDFGLVRSIDDARRTFVSIDEMIVGTPAYMSPEQAMGEPVGPASDWYSVGAMLYEALTGCPPHTGTSRQVMLDKQHIDPPAPTSLGFDVPEDLEQLAMALLRRTPAERPSLADIRHAVLPTSLDSMPPSARVSVAIPHFRGRDDALGQLHTALAATTREGGTAVVVSGGPGLGKSALVEQFLHEVSLRENAVVLEGRCHERESVPFKAVDSIVDALSGYLRRLPPAEAATFLPRDIPVLARVFPVLGRVPAVAEARRRVAPPSGLRDTRRRAFVALREMLGRIAATTPVIVIVDDAQWGDADSAELVASLLAPPGAPEVLWLFTATTTTTRGGWTELLRDRLAARGAPAPAAIEIGPLDDEGARALARVHLGSLHDEQSLVEAIVAEAHGRPLHLVELSRFIREAASTNAPSPQRGPGMSLESVVQSRIEALSDEPRRLLIAIALSARPLGADVHGTGAGIPQDDVGRALSALRRNGLVRTEVTNRRVAHSVASELVQRVVLRGIGDEERQEYHGRLAAAVKRDVQNPLPIVEHLLAAGRPDLASEAAEMAGDHAMKALAFDTAATLFGIALEHGGVVSAERSRKLHVALGEALDSAGHGVRAAYAYMCAAESAPPRERTELSRLAGEQLLRSGRVDEGIRVLGDALTALGVGIPESADEVQKQLMAALQVLFERGYDFGPPVSRGRGSVAIDRTDLCYAAALGFFGVTMNGLGPLFTFRHLRHALDTGDPFRVARGLALFCFVLPSTHQTDPRALARLKELEFELEDPRVTGWYRCAEAAQAFWFGEMRTALLGLAAADQIWSERCAGLTRELSSCRVMRMTALATAGHLVEWRSLYLLCVDDARRRDDLYLETHARAGAASFWLPRDEPERGAEEVRAALARWRRDTLDYPTWVALLGLVRIDLYQGEAQRAFDRIETRWNELKASMISLVPLFRTQTLTMRGFAALAALSGSSDPKRLRDVVEYCARALAEAPMPCTGAVSEALRAGLLELDGETQTAIERYELARDALPDDAAQALLGASLKRRIGLLRNDPEGDALVREADEAMRIREIRNPQRWAAMYGPRTGFGA